MRAYRCMSLVLMLAFAVVGLLFLLAPDKPLAFFNALSSPLGLPPSPANGWDFYLILAAAYMYLVTVLAFSMYRHPENRLFPKLLAHAKLASATLSLALFLLQARHLIYLANFAVDGAIGIAALVIYLKMRRASWVCS